MRPPLDREPDEVLAMIIDAHMAWINRKIERAGEWLTICATAETGYCLRACPP